MVHDLHVNLPIPDPERFEDDRPVYTLVGDPVIEYTIDWHLAYHSLRKVEDGPASDRDLWDQLDAASAAILSRLVPALNDHRHGGEIEAIVDTVTRLCYFAGPKELEALEALRGTRATWSPRQDGDVDFLIDGLLALCAEMERRRTEHRQRRRSQGPQPAPEPAGGITAEDQEAAPGQVPEPRQDPGWEF